jgi:putative DNA primase/helicase
LTDTTVLPAQLKENALFCVWKYEERDGKATKVPYNPRTGGMAQSNNRTTFAPLTVAEAAQAQYDGLGVGIFDDVCAIDIDHCITDGQFNGLCMDVMATMNAYTEYSPSGTGIRILFKATGFVYDKTKYYINNQGAGLEIYIAGATQKYVTVTGNSITQGYDLEERGAELQTILDRYMVREKKPARDITTPHLIASTLEEHELIGKAKGAKNGDLFSALYAGDITSYKSQSEADQALCNMLAFWTNCDPVRMDRLFRVSGLMRDKWDRQQSGSTYGAITIQEAIASCTTTYNPQAHFESRASRICTGSGTNKKNLAQLHPDKNDRYGWHDMGNGFLFADWYKDKARYVPERKKWFIYNGKVWKPDAGDLKVMELCKELADDLMIYALSLQDEKHRQEYMDFIKKWQKRNFRETIIKDATSVYPIEMTQFDADPMYFNCQNGTLNLETREFHAHRAGDLLSKISNVVYNPEAKSERWERFINEIMQGNADKAMYLQKALGYALTGDTRHECFFVLYGATSRNGKGTTMETFMRMMGDYGMTGKPDTIAQKQTVNGSGPSEDIARLAGARFVNISEPDKKLVLSAALVKTLTGNDTITARFLNENSFEYKPQFKLFINTNHLPAVTDITLFSSGRVKIIPFERHFTEAERDEQLKSELVQANNLSGVLNWCLDGLWMIGETGFKAPDCVVSATDEYRKNCDKIGRFIDEEMEADGAAETKTSEVYSRYQSWCSGNGYYPENATNFKGSLSNIARVERKRPRSGGGQTTLLLGYRLRSNFSEPDPFG